MPRLHCFCNVVEAFVGIMPFLYVKWLFGFVGVSFPMQVSQRAGQH